MPRYDYECEKCGSSFEAEHPMAVTPRVTCPKCKSAQTKRVIKTCPGISLDWNDTEGLSHTGTKYLPAT